MNQVSEELIKYIESRIDNAINKHEKEFSLYGIIFLALFLLIQEEIVRLIFYIHGGN